MILTITNTKPPATDIGYLFHKNPSGCQSFSLSFGKAHVFYPEADNQPGFPGWHGATVDRAGNRIFDPSRTERLSQLKNSGQRCTIALLLDVDSVGMIRGNRNKFWESFSLPLQGTGQ